MELSEAIRVGAKLRPRQAFYEWFDKSGGSCVLGAAMEAVGVARFPDTYAYHGKCPDSWKWTTREGQCPACEEERDQIQSLLRHLNNDHRWTRERIADWVESEEAIKPPAPVAAVRKRRVKAVRPRA